MDAQPHKRLVADVGGTNTRIALYDVELGQLRAVATYINRDFDCLESIIEKWLERLSEPTPDHACIAVAAPPSTDIIQMLNMNWRISCASVQRRFRFKKLKWINDFEAVAYALPHLTPEQSYGLQLGVNNQGKLAALGPGTGLGGATVELIGNTAHVSACEPGHMALAPQNELECALLHLLSNRHHNLYNELLISGPGLMRIYQGLCELREDQPRATSSFEISALGMETQDQNATDALSMFCAMLGSIAGDFVLANGAYGGLFLAGGIVPTLLPFLSNSAFVARFTDKGGMADRLSSVPLHVVTAAQPGLIGAAHTPL